jgi:hypothetical protein
MAAPELRPMGIGDILDVTFRLYRQRFSTFLLIALVVYVPYALLASLGQPFMLVQQPNANQEVGFQEMETRQGDAGITPVPAISPVGLALTIGGFAVFVILLLPLCSAALVHNISASYLGLELTAGQSYARAAPRLLGLIGTQILVFLAIALGYVLLIVPGIIFSLWLLLVVPIVMLEGRFGTSAMGRSRELMRGNLGRGFLIGLLVAILVAIINWILGLLTQWVPWPHPAMHVFFSVLLAAVVLPIQTAPWILLYYDLRIRKEAFDLQMLSTALGQAAVNGPAAT